MSSQQGPTCRGITISVTAETNAGGRRHMEDYIAVNLAPSEEDFNEIGYLREQAYIGVFDGHGGKEAAKCAREKLWQVIQKQPKFRSPDLQHVTESVREAYVALHKEMEPLRAHWKKNKMGDLSTAGTTASTVIFRQDHIIVANVGDSTAVLAVSNPRAGEEGQHPVVAKTLTVDHKPEDPNETARIRKQGGNVMLSRKGVPRVVWQRERKLPKSSNDSPDGPTNPPAFDSIPFLSVARSLGDFWSLSPTTNEFVVSPSPDVHIHPLEPKEQKFVVIASDGLWNVMTPTQVVQFIWDYEHDDQTCHQPKDVVKAVINEALRRWKAKNLLADNIAVLIAFLTEEEVPISQIDSVNTGNEVRDSVTSTTNSLGSETIIPRKDHPPAQNSHTASSPVIQVHTKTKLRHRSRQGESSTNCQYTTTLSPTAERANELRKRRKRANKAEETEESPTKRSRLDLTTLDSGLDMDSQVESTDGVISSEEVSNGEARTVHSEPAEVSSESMEDSSPTFDSLPPIVPKSVTDDDEDSSSGVSSDNSDPEGMPQHDPVCSSVVKCPT